MLEELDLQEIEERVLGRARFRRKSPSMSTHIDGKKSGNYSEKGCCCGSHHGGAKSNLNHHSTRKKYHIRQARKNNLY